MFTAKNAAQGAVLEAADFIEVNPQRYDFAAYAVPKSTDRRGCALAWIGYFYHQRQPTEGRFKHSSAVARFVLGTHELDFYHRMYRLRGMFGGMRTDWTKDARYAARLLRKYARKYL